MTESVSAKIPIPSISFAAQLVAVVTLVALLSGLSVGLLAVDRARATARATILDSELAAADLAAKLSATYVRSAEDEVRDLADSPVIRDAVAASDEMALRREFAIWLSDHPLVDSVVAFDANGTRLALGFEPANGVERGDVPPVDWFEGVITSGEATLGTPSVSLQTGRPRLPYAVPVRGRGAKLLGVLMGGISLQSLSDAFTDLRLGPQSRISLLDLQHGLVLAHVDPSRILTPMAENNELAQRLRRGEHQASENVSGSGERTLGAAARGPGRPGGGRGRRPAGGA